MLLLIINLCGQNLQDALQKKRQRETHNRENWKKSYEKMEGSVTNEMVKECDCNKIIEEYEQPICEF